MEIQAYYLWLGAFFGFLMAWGIGANDVANAMGTSVGSKAITIRQAIFIAVVFEFAGSFLAGGEVTNTIREGIIYTGPFLEAPKLLVIGMLASLLASAVWLFIATHFGWPVSTTHTIIGAIVGFAAVGIGIDTVQWGNVGYIALSWILSPILGGIIAYGLFRSVQHFIFNKPDPIASAKKAVPYYMMIAGWVVTMVTLDQGIKNLGLDLPFMTSFVYSIPVSVLLYFIGRWAVQRLKLDPKADKNFHFTNVERIFGILMIFTGCAMAFAHGSNDVANAIGPVAAIAHAVSNHGDILKSSPIPVWVLLLGSAGIVAGLVMYGHKVIATIGSGITELTPSRGFSATLSAAATVVLASGAGLPISTTHTLVGAVLGIGLAKGIHALNLSVIGTILISWIITLPAGAILSIIFFEGLRFLLL
jgi:PiT family inorganic phosphate transporter